MVGAVIDKVATPVADNTQRITSDVIYLAKGLAIVLVLMGHYGPTGWWPSWYTTIITVIYLFHMPLFMCLSGYLTAWSINRQLTSGKSFNYGEYVRKRFIRLLIPYLVIQGIYIVVKVILNKGLHFNYDPVTRWSLLGIFVNPINAPSQMLWFIYSLLLMTLLVPLIRRLVRHDVVLIALAVVLYFIPVPNTLGTIQVPMLHGSFAVQLPGTLFTLDRLHDMFLSFCLGYLLCEYGFFARIKHWAAQIGLAALVLFAALSAFVLFDQSHADFLLRGARLLALLSGVIGSLALFYAWRAVRPAPWPLLATLGKSSSMIYFFHQLIVFFVALTCLKMLHFTGSKLIIGLPVALVFGLGIPTLLDQWVLPKSALLTYLLTGSRKSVDG